MIWYTYDDHIWTSYMIWRKLKFFDDENNSYTNPYIDWLVHIWFDIQIIYRFQTIYDLTYDLKSLLTYDPIYGLAQRSYVARIWSYVDRIWFEIRFRIWFENRYMTTIYGLVDIWSHIWSVNPMWCTTMCACVIYVNHVFVCLCFIYKVWVIVHEWGDII